MDDFGVPGASLGEALGTILRDKFRGEKSDEKKVGKLVASAGDADPGQGGFWEDPRHRQRSSTPSLILRMGGRIPRAAHRPPRWSWSAQRGCGGKLLPHGISHMLRHAG